MKYLVLIFALTLTTSAMAGVCKLDTPVKINDPSFDTFITLKNVKTDELPKFEGNKYDPNRDQLHIHIFKINVNNIITDFVGVQLNVDGEMESIGSANGYFGNLIDVTGTTAEGNGEIIYTSTAVNHLNEKQNLATYTSVTVKDGFVTSVILSIPVYKRIREELNVYYYTGEQQTLCVQSATN